jgi:methyl-accepting chemotaxis protein
MVRRIRKKSPPEKKIEKGPNSMNRLSFFSKSLMGKQMIGFLAMAIVPSVILTLIITRMSMISLRESIQRNLIVNADNKTSALESYAATRIRDVNAVCSGRTVVTAFIEMQNALKASNFDTKAESYQKSLKDHTNRIAKLINSLNFDDALLLDLNHQVIFNFQKPDRVGNWLEEPPYDQTNLTTTIERVSALLQPEFSDFETLPGDTELSSFLIAPVYEELKLIGFIAVKIDENDIYKIVNDYTGLGLTGRVLVADNQTSGNNQIANLILKPRPVEGTGDVMKITRLAGQISPLFEAIDGGRGFDQVILPDGRHVVTAWMYVPSFRWGLVIEQDFQEAFELTERIQAAGQILLVITAILALVITYWASKRLAGRVIAVADSAMRLASGDLTTRAPVTGQDEIANMARSFNLMAEKIQTSDTLQSQNIATLEANAKALLDAAETEEKTRQTLKQTAMELNEAGEVLVETALEGNQTAIEQETAVSEVVATVEQIRATAEQTSSRAEAVAAITTDSAQSVAKGSDLVNQIVNSMNNLRVTVNDYAREIATLSERMRQIDQITDTVNEIADQSKLLALNATIEAAKAGEQGKGFAVVAGEVRNLAEQSKTANTKIRTMLGEIRKAADSTVLATEKGVNGVDSTLGMTQVAGKVIEQLSDSLNKAAVAVSQISHATRQQYVGIDQINQSMREFQESTRQLTSSMKKTQNASELLNELSGTLLELTDSN